MSLSLIWRDCLVRFQRTAIRETGRRPIAFVRDSSPKELFLPGCSQPGFTCWQPMPWNSGAPLGQQAERFHPSIAEYVSLCQFLEMRFTLPVLPSGSPLSFLYRRVFETLPNTELSPPARAFEEALERRRTQPHLPLAFCMAATCDEGTPLYLLLQASDGQAFLLSSAQPEQPVFLKMGLDRLLPKLQFVYQVGSGQRAAFPAAQSKPGASADQPEKQPQEPCAEPKTVVAQYVPFRYACDFFEPAPLHRQRMRLAQLYYEGNPFLSNLWMPWPDVSVYVDKARRALDVRALCEGFQIAPSADPVQNGGLYPNRIRVVNVCDPSLQPLAANVLNNPAYGSGLSPTGMINRLLFLAGSEQLLKEGKLKEEACSLTCENLHVPEADYLRMRELAEWQEHKGRLIDAMHQRDAILAQLDPQAPATERTREVLNAKVDRLASLLRIAPSGYVQPSGYDADIAYLQRKHRFQQGDLSAFEMDAQRENRIESGFAMRSAARSFPLNELYAKPERETPSVPAAKTDAKHRLRASDGQWFEQLDMFSTLNSET